MDNGDLIPVRGIPMARMEVVFHEQRLGAMFFDESVFHTDNKRKAAANVLAHLDIALKIYLERQGLSDIPEEPIAIDIHDPSWLYIPVKMFGPESGIIVMPTKSRPAGLYAWFRMKKGYRSAH